MEYFDIIFFFLSIVLFWYSFHNKNGCPTNWPIVGMLPALIKNFHTINDYFAEILEKTGLTFTFSGPWFINKNMLFTADTRNVHHITSKNFQNYVKGPEFNNEICDFLGETIINTDSSKWLFIRTLAQTIFKDPRFQQFYFTKVLEKVETGLIPILNHISNQGLEIDLQDFFTRFSFDVTCSLILDYDPKSLSIDLPNLPILKALDDIAEGILHRLLMPKYIWKLQRWLGIGLEKKLNEACETFEKFFYKTKSLRLNDMNDELCEAKEANSLNPDILTLFMSYQKENNSLYHGKNNIFFQDTFLSLLLAGRDTVSTALCWFFYLLLKNPQTLTKIKDELDLFTINTNGEDNKSVQFTLLSSKFKELDSKLLYLHAALCEALRLYPPIPFEMKTALESDVLPSNHHVSPNVPIIISIYSMARMPSIWGDDCYEFKLERWISETRKIKNVPSYKFFSFLSGPRTCLGKSMAFTQLKAVAIAILKNYHIQAVEDHPTILGASIILQMKYGFKAKVMRSM